MAVNLNVISQFDAKGLNRAQAELDKLASKTTSISTKLSGAAKVAGAGILVGAGAVAAGLFEIGSSFDEAFDNIRIGTGATGPALEGLQNDMKAVAGAVPTSFGDAGKAITVFSQKLGLTGAPLQTLSSQVLELSRMTGTDLGGNLTAVTDVFNNFGVGAADQSGKLDLLFRASQASGVSVSELAGTMSGAGVVLREVGLSFDQSAGFIATLAKAGVDAGDVMPALSKSLASAAKQGKDASTVFTDTFNAIKGAPDDVAGAGVALDVFGAKAGPKLAALIREGKLSYEDMTAAIAGGGDTILGASGDTQDFAEKLTMLKNRVFLAIEPIATKVFNAIGEAMDKLAPKIEQLVNWMTENGDTMKIVAGIIGGIMLVVLAAYTVSMLAAAAATVAAAAPFILIAVLIAALIAGVIYAYKNFETFRNVVDAVWQGIQTAISFAWENIIKPIWDIIVFYITKILIPYYTFLWNVVKTVFEGIVSAVQSAWGFIQTAFNAIKSGIETVWGFFQTAKDIIGTVFTNIADAISGPFKTAFNFISDAWNNTVGKLSWSVPGWVPIIGGNKIEAPKLPRFAEGGIFNTGMGGGSGLAVLHDNEMILNPQQQKALFSGNGLGSSGSINVTINMPPGSNGSDVVNAIKRYEKTNGTSWRN
jgi:TP901 family phage tail tape measure protein